MEDKMKEIETMLKGAVSEVIEKELPQAVAPIVSNEVKGIMDRMKAERSLFGKDISGLSTEEKSNLVEIAKAVAMGKTKANEALIEEVDGRGGYLVPKEVAAAIVRIAATVGVAMGKVTKWTMNTDELGIPAYDGSYLEGEYLGVDSAGSVTALTFDQANLIAKKWQLAFAVGNDLLADASVDLADWLLALAAEALANRVDKEVFAGSGTPFLGVLNHPDVTVHTMTTGKETFAEFDVVEASDVIANLEESLLDGAAFFFHRTVWAKIRAQKDTAGNYIFGYSNTDFVSFDSGSGIKPAGFILGYPVYTVRHLPANSATAVSTKFGIFGNLKAVAYGDRGSMAIEQFKSGSFGGKEIALADQSAMVLKHRHAVVLTLPAAFVVIKTAAS